jgi:hypothetical protein
MRVLRKLSILFGANLLIAGVVWLVLTSNLESSVYPIDADSLGIPLFDSAITAGIGFVLAVVSSVFCGLAYWLASRTKSRAALLVSQIALALVDLLVVAFFVFWGLSWFVPHHYLISVACWLAAATMVYLSISDLCNLRPNSSFKPTPLRGAA